MSDFVVKIGVRNGRLLRAIRAKYGTSAEMSRKSGVGQTVIASLLTMRASPVNGQGDWTKAAYDISSALAMEPEEIWPAHIAQIKLKRNEAELNMDVADVQSLLAGDTARKALAKWCDGISPRHMKALVMIADGATLDETGKELGVSRDRARQIFFKAAEKVRRRAFIAGVKSVEDFRQ